MTINEIQDQIIKEFSDFDDWLKKYEYLIELGDSLDSSDEALKTEENMIAGCQSNAWLKAEMQNGKVLFAAETDAKITRGIIALLLRVLNDQPAENIVNADLYFIDRVGLSSNLSPSRANGLASILKEIKTLAMKMQNMKKL